MRSWGLLLLCCCFCAAPSLHLQAAQRPGEWAAAVQLEGVPNLHRVSDTLYRSAQPSAAGLKNLRALGVRTVVNLRSFHSDGDQIAGTGLNYEQITMKAWHPEEKEAIRFLRLVTDPARQPLLVHCQHGADRTGTMIALYRIAVQGWTKEAALREMTEGGFGYHDIWINLPDWIEELDVQSLRSKAGIPGRTEQIGEAGSGK